MLLPVLSNASPLIWIGFVVAATAWPIFLGLAGVNYFLRRQI
jgi:hypothetical protein